MLQCLQRLSMEPLPWDEKVVSDLELPSGCIQQRTIVQTLAADPSHQPMLVKGLALVINVCRHAYMI
jgi:hypothetical protein